MLLLELLAVAPLLAQDPGIRPRPAWVLEGEALIEGHFAKPEEVRKYRARVEHVVADDGDAEALAWTTWWTAADAPRSVTRVVRHGDRTWLETDGRARLVTSESDLRWAGALLSLGARGPAPVIETAFTHGRLGDVVDVTRRVLAGDAAATPSAVTASLHDAGVVVSFDLTCATAAAAAGVDAGRLLAPPLDAPRDEPPSAAAIQVRALGPGLHEALVPSYDSRALVVTLGDELAVVQAPGDAWTGDALVAALGEALPGRPIRWVVPTHHHPHSLGAVRAFVAVGAKVVTTPGNEAYVRKLVAAPFTLRPDRLAALGASRPAVEFVRVEGHLRLGDEDAALELFDIGARSRHTDEHLVALARPAGILFHGDLGWHPDGTGGVRVGTRAQGLLDTIAAPPGGGAPLEVTAILQSWPVRDVPATFTPEALKAALE